MSQASQESVADQDPPPLLQDDLLSQPVTAITAHMRDLHSTVAATQHCQQDLSRSLTALKTGGRMAACLLAEAEP